MYKQKLRRLISFDEIDFAIPMQKDHFNTKIIAETDSIAKLPKSEICSLDRCEFQEFDDRSIVGRAAELQRHGAIVMTRAAPRSLREGY